MTVSTIVIGLVCGGSSAGCHTQDHDQRQKHSKELLHVILSPIMSLFTVKNNRSPKRITGIIFHPIQNTDQNQK